MSSLQVCAQKLLTQKAIQGSHHEHIAHQLTEVHRTERNASLSLKSLISDVQRRLCDYKDVRLTSAQLTKQLMQDKLKLQALMLAVNESGRVKHEVMQVLSECTEQWSTIPAQLVQLLRILSERKQCILVARQFTVQLRSTQTIYSIAHDTIMVHSAVQRNICGQAKQWSQANKQLALQCAIVTTSIKQSLQAATHRMKSALDFYHVQQVNAEQQLLQVEEMNSMQLVKHDGLRQRGDLARQYVRELLQCVEQSACNVTQKQQNLSKMQKVMQQLQQSANAQAVEYVQLQQKRDEELQIRKHQLSELQSRNCLMSENTKNVHSVIAFNQDAVRHKQKEVYVLQWMTQLLTRVRTEIASYKHKAAAQQQDASMTEMDWKKKQEVALQSIRMARYQSQCQQAVQALAAQQSLTRRAMCVEQAEERQWYANLLTKAKAELRQREEKKQKQQQLNKHEQQKWKVQLHHRDKGKKGTSKRDRVNASQLNEATLRQHESYYSIGDKTKNTKIAKVQFAKQITCPFLAGTASSIATSHSAMSAASATAKSNKNQNYNHNIMSIYNKDNDANINNTNKQTSKRPRCAVVRQKADVTVDRREPHKLQTTYAHTVPSPSPLPRRPYHIPLQQHGPLSSLSSVIIPFPANSLTQLHHRQQQQQQQQQQRQHKPQQEEVNKQNRHTVQNSHTGKALMNEQVGAADVMLHGANAEKSHKLQALPQNKQWNDKTSHDMSVAIGSYSTNVNKEMYDNINHNYINKMYDSVHDKNDDDDNDDELADGSDSDTNSMASAVSVLSAALSTLKSVTTASNNAAGAVVGSEQKSLQSPIGRTFHEPRREGSMSKVKQWKNTQVDKSATVVQADKHVRFDQQRQKQQQMHQYNKNSNAAQRNWHGEMKRITPNDQSSNVHLPLSASPSPSPSTSSSSPVLSDLAPALLIRNRPHNQSRRFSAWSQLPAKQQQGQWKVQSDNQNLVPLTNSRNFTSSATTITNFVDVGNKNNNAQEKFCATMSSKGPVRPSRIKMARSKKADAGKVTQLRRKANINYSDDIFADIYS